MEESKTMFYSHKYPEMTLKVDPIIDDTTLRDGVQMPGITVSPRHTAHIAYLLDAINVERIELHHFQEPDKEAVKLIQDMNLEVRLGAWCRAVKEDVDSALSLDFENVGISHPVSYLHFKAKWPDILADELMGRVVDTVEYAKDHGLIIFVHGEDSTRADWEFERKFVNAIADVGASVYRICDTVGVGSSDPKASLPKGIPMKVKKIAKETRIEAVEVHAHDDLGNSVENTMAAIRAADGCYDKVYASTTLLGIGERSGNAETEKVMMNLYLHYGVKKFKNRLWRLKEVADYVSFATRVVIPPNKAIVGRYSFAHESGIHTHGVLRDPKTYEPFPPELVGNVRRLTIGKQSGITIIKHKVETITGRNLNKHDPRIEILSQMIKDIYSSGARKSSLGEREFKKLALEAGFNV